jgi:hypothetical protein
MDLRDAEVQLSAQRLRELMLWHGKDEGNLPPAATLANLSRDTIAAFRQLQLLRTQMSELRAALSQIFWSCDSSAVRRTVLEALGAPPEGEAVAPPPPAVGWAASPNGLPLPALAGEAERTQSTSHHAAG